MNQTGPDAQTPPAKVLFPLGGAFIVFPIIALVMMDLGPVADGMMVLTTLAGAGMIWQGTKNLKRDKA